ncbi:putative ribonuclease H-like domain-containing protein [Tanacetum coccineum]
MTHPSPKRNMVPKAVLMRSGLVSLTTARPVNIAQPKSTVNSARPMTNVFNKAHSTIRRPINNKTATKNSNFNQGVNTVKDKNVNAARPKAVVNTAKPKAVLNVVKASACWVQFNNGLGPLKRMIFLPHVQGNPQIDLQDQGVIDNGCSRHITGNMSYLTDFKEIDGGYVAFRGNPKGGKIIGIVPRKNNMYSVDLKNIVPKGGLTCLFIKATSDESKLWHRRLGHINFKTMNKLVKGNLVRGLPSKLFKNDQTCVACWNGYSKRKPKMTKPSTGWKSQNQSEAKATIKVKTVNKEQQLQALVDGKKNLQEWKTQKSRRPKKKDTKVPQPSDLTNVADEAVNEEMDDSLVRAATTATGLDAEQDRDMFDVNDLPSEKVFVAEQGVPDSKKDNAAQATITEDEITLAIITGIIKNSKKPKVTTVTTATTKGILLQDPSESITTTTIPSKDKGKCIMVEEPAKIKKKDQISFDEQEAIRIQELIYEEERLAREKDEANIALTEEWNDIQAKIKANQLLAERLQAREQEELTIEEKDILFQQLLGEKKKALCSKKGIRKEEQATYKSSTKEYYVYLPEEYARMEPSKTKRNKPLPNIQEIPLNKAMKRVNTFVAMDTKLVKGSEVRNGAEITQEGIVPDEEEVAVDAIPLATKPPSIVDFKILKEGKINYFQIIRADGSSNWPEEDYERVLWGDLKTMFEPHVEDLVWRNLQGNKVLIWKLSFIPMKKYAAFTPKPPHLSCDNPLLIRRTVFWQTDPKFFRKYAAHPVCAPVFLKTPESTGRILPK